MQEQIAGISVKLCAKHGRETFYMERVIVCSAVVHDGYPADGALAASSPRTAKVLNPRFF